MREGENRVKLRVFTSKTTPIGLEIGESEVHAVQFTSKSGQLELLAASSQPILNQNGGAGELAAVRAVLGSAPFQGKSVVCSLSNDEVDTRPLLMPVGISPEDERPFRKALMEEARSALSYSPENAVIDYLPFGSKMLDEEERFSLLLVATPLEVVNRYTSLLRAAGVHCSSMDIGPSAVSRVLYNDERTYCVINVDDESTQVSIGNKGHLLFSRTVRLGSKTMIEQLEKSLSVSRADAVFLIQEYGCAIQSTDLGDFENLGSAGSLCPSVLSKTVNEICHGMFEALAMEVKRSIEYFTRQREHHPVEESMVVGNILPGHIEQFLRDRLAIPVSSMSVFSRLDVELKQRVAGEDRYVVAAGLALRNVEAA